MKDSVFLKAVKNRRSIYDLGNKQILSPDEIMELINEAVKQAPSAFNSQSARVVVLFGENYQRLWNMVLDALRPLIPVDKFSATEERIASFKTGYGTILFFEDEEVVRNLQDKYPLYRDNFPVWSEQSSGMLQYIVWTALAEAGVGASLQHYNPLIDVVVAKEWGVPVSWRLKCEMPFGSIAAPADAKSFLPLENRVKVFK